MFLFKYQKYSLIKNLRKIQLLSRFSSIIEHKKSIQDPESYWRKIANDISWIKKFSKVLDTSNSPFNKWFSDGNLNVSYNCIDIHCKEGRGTQNAIIFESPVTDTIKKYTYNELLDQVNKFSSLLVSEGVKKGDRVVIYMPNIPETLIAMLSCARIGAIHSVVFGGFSSIELASRLVDCSPKLIISASCGIDGSKIIDYKILLEGAIKIANESNIKINKCIILQRKISPAILIPGKDIDWEISLSNINKSTYPDIQIMNSSDPLYILYTSGTTGKPKGVLRDTAGHIIALKWSMRNIYNCKPGDVFWAASDVGWVVGHSFSVYGPLLLGCTTIIYEGKPVGTPDESNFWRIIERNGVNVFFTSPTAIRAIKQMDNNGISANDFNMKSLKYFFLAGERADSDTIKWAKKVSGVPVLDHWWQTETGWPITANCIGLDGILPINYGSSYKPVPGYDLRVIDNNLNEVKPGIIGTLAIKLPLPPGFALTLYNADQRYIDSYFKAFPGFYDTGDSGYIEDGNVYVMSRTDDVINVAGHRLSTGAMEEILIDHPDVAEAAVIGLKDSFKGQIPFGLLVLNKKYLNSHERIISDVIAMVRERIGPVASFKSVVIVERLPKTRSGKILRSTLRCIANHDDYNIPATIEDPIILEEIKNIILSKEK